jgi:hypothetical protein
VKGLIDTLVILLIGVTLLYIWAKLSPETYNAKIQESKQWLEQVKEEPKQQIAPRSKTAAK